MIQLTRGSDASTSYANYFYLDIYDAYKNKNYIAYRPVITLKSQETGNFVNMLPMSGASYFNTTNKERYVKMTITLDTAQSLGVGFVNLGTIDMPFGFYDVTIRENKLASLPSSQADVNALNIVYQGLAYVFDNEFTRQVPAVEYTEYTDNDTDKNNVYITNTYT